MPAGGSRPQAVYSSPQRGHLFRLVRLGGIWRQIVAHQAAELGIEVTWRGRQFVLAGVLQRAPLTLSVEAVRGGADPVDAYHEILLAAYENTEIAEALAQDSAYIRLAFKWRFAAPLPPLRQGPLKAQLYVLRQGAGHPGSHSSGRFMPLSPGWGIIGKDQSQVCIVSIWRLN